MGSPVNKVPSIMVLVEGNKYAILIPVIKKKTKVMRHIYNINR